jgi:integrase
LAHLTKALVEASKPLDGKHETFIWDDELRGLGLRITDTGFKSFVWQGRVKGGRMRRLTLKPYYPLLTVAQARHKWVEIKDRVARGEDPTTERKREREESTLGDLIDAYLKDGEVRGLRSLPRARRRLEQHVARWRTRKASDISRDEVARLHAKIAEERGHVIANRTVTLLRTVFNYGADRGLFKGENPAGRIKLYREQRRERFLNADELTRVNEALAAEPNEYWRAYFALALLLGTRRSELLAARWADIELGVKPTLRLPATKTGEPHLLPLPEAAVAILEKLPSLHASDWVFPGDGATGHLVEVKKAWQRIRQRAGVEDVTVHDLRRTLGSWLASQGSSLLLIGKALHHRSPRATEIYARLDLDPVREALERNARLMLGANAYGVEDDANAT